ncbi:FIST C-terminal domain-containing protein [Sorangium sp. So ce1099]|uniref:FIST C-terminal domain-containing protein n=1 Tax=Sorangium sp. So ce1099 TaxID=3133331 RepID=UPI003F61F232
MARSFSATCGPDGLLHHLVDLRSAVPSASGGIVFVSGQLAQRASGVAELVRSTWRGIPACVVPAAGVLSERGELEGDTGASGVLWSGGRVAPFALPERADDPSRALRETLARTIGPRSATAILFARPGALAAGALEGLASCVPGACLFGAGTASSSAIGVTSQGELIEGPVTGLAITGFAPPIVDASPAARLLSGFHLVEEVSGGVVLRAGGRSALDLLSAATATLGEQASAQPLVLAALADPAVDPRGGPAEPRGDAAEPAALGSVSSVGAVGSVSSADSVSSVGSVRYVLRPIRGIDPSRRGLLLGDDARPGGRLAFAVRDAAAARAGLEGIARQVSRSALGSAPRFALYLSCAGRGQGLYGAPDVEARILRQRFADLPIAGMHSSFEIAPWAPGEARLALYTGVLALFRAPS